MQGWQKVEEQTKPNIESKQAFVAMWFDDSLHPAYSEGDEYMEWVGLPYTIANRLTGIVSPDRTVELKGNVKVGQSLVSPSYKNDRGLPLSIRIELPELAGVK